MKGNMVGNELDVIPYEAYGLMEKSKLLINLIGELLQMWNKLECNILGQALP